MPFDGVNFEQDDPILRTLIRADELLSNEAHWLGWNNRELDWVPAMRVGAAPDGGDRYCLGCALSIAQEEVTGEADRCWLGPAFDAVRAPIERVDADALSVAQFNDARERTFDDVKGVLARAIAHRRAEIMETV